LLPPGIDVLYECGECGERYLNQRRCDDCTRFCRRLGPALLCPSCDEPILLSELLADFQTEVAGLH
jgi:predicted SprT family Zn-dependent metalloprotease